MRTILLAGLCSVLLLTALAPSAAADHEVTVCVAGGAWCATSGVGPHDGELCATAGWQAPPSGGEVETCAG